VKKKIDIPFLYSITITVLCVIVFSLTAISANVNFSNSYNILEGLVAATIFIMVLYSIFCNGPDKVKET